MPDMGPGPPLSHLSDSYCPDAKSALSCHPGNKPGMRNMDIPVPEINTGGERQVLNPTTKQA